MFDPLAYPSVEAATDFVFGPDGPMAQKGWQIRSSQRDLAMAAARAIDAEEGRPSWVLGEAPCGTGKGLAYLIPGVIAALRAEARFKTGARIEGEKSFRKLVVSTANIALQGQLVNKDIPGVAAILGVEIRSALYKGRANFLCKERVQDEGSGLVVDHAVKRLVDWSRDPECSGDREDLTWDPGFAWAKLSVSADGCHGKKCPFYRAEQAENVCYAERARVGMEVAHVVIINHYLLALTPRAIPSVLLAVDEGHELEDCVRRARAEQLSERGIDGMVNKIRKALNAERADLYKESMDTLFYALGEKLDGGEGYTEELRPGWCSLGEGCWDNIRETSRQVAKLATQTEDQNEAGKLEKLSDNIDMMYLRAWSIGNGKPHPELSGGSDDPWAVWCNGRTENRKRSITATLAPADVGPDIQAMQRAYPRTMVTSATLAVDGKFTYVRNCLGMTGLLEPAKFGDVEIALEDGSVETVSRQLKAAGPVEELVLPSPYDLGAMAALIVPPDVLNPKDGRWQQWAPAAVVDVVKRAQGRTLVLASSNRMMERYFLALDGNVDYPVRVQGSSGRNDLIRWFKETTDGVLVATRSFFQGLDVQGESLSCVIIDRIPFDPPGDPLEDAVGALVAARGGGNPFSARTLPKTCMTLAQAAGRLIRSQDDRGVVVCLDQKLVTGSMSGVLIRSFTGFPLSREMGDIARVIDGLGITPIPKSTARGVVRRKYAAP